MNRAWVLAGAVASLLVSSLLAGCQGACAEAEDLCVECGRPAEECEFLFSDESSDFCEDAVTTYQNNCKDAPAQ